MKFIATIFWKLYYTLYKPKTKGQIMRQYVRINGYKIIELKLKRKD